jgi:hypothetical protein
LAPVCCAKVFKFDKMVSVMLNQDDTGPAVLLGLYQDVSVLRWLKEKNKNLKSKIKKSKNQKNKKSKNQKIKKSKIQKFKNQKNQTKKIKKKNQKEKVSVSR